MLPAMMAGMGGTGARAAVGSMAGSAAKSSIAGLEAAVKKLGAAAKDSTGALGNATSQLANLFLAPLNEIKGIANSIAGLVQLANPAVVQVFTRTLNDAFAVIGGMLTPVLKGLTIAGRAWGDTFARLQPVIQPLFDQLGQSLANAAFGATQIVEAMSPFIQLLADGMVKSLRVASFAIGMLQGVVIGLANTIGAFFGLTSKLDKNRNSRNAAVYSPQVSGVEDFARAQFAKQMEGMFGAKQGADPLAVLPEIATAVAAGAEAIKLIAGDVTAVVTFLNGMGKGVLGGAKDILDMTPLGLLRKALIS